MHKIITFLTAIVVVLTMATGCTLDLKGLNATDGDKTLNVESLETTKDE